MGGGVRETHLDDDYMATGSHDGADATATLRHMGADFKSCGVDTDRVIYNVTDDEDYASAGTITAVTENEITTDLSWDKDDEYEIYITDTKDSEISSIWTDKRYGRRADKDNMHGGILPGDEDLDEYEDNVFGPGQPERGHR